MEPSGLHLGVLRGLGFRGLGFRVSGYRFGGPNNKDYSIVGSILGSPHFWKLPYRNDGIKHGNHYIGFNYDYIGVDTLNKEILHELSLLYNRKAKVWGT